MKTTLFALFVSILTVVNAEAGPAPVPAPAPVPGPIPVPGPVPVPAKPDKLPLPPPPDKTPDAIKKPGTPVEQLPGTDKRPASAADAEPVVTKVATGDKTFVLAASRAGLAEVALGKLAASQASAPAVKSFAAQMVTDHGKANAELTSMAAGKGLTAPTEPDKKHKAVIAKLAKLTGPAFDKAYVTLMVAEHRAAVALFTKESKKGQDVDLKAWAGKTLPILRGHLTMASELVKGSTS